MPPTDFIGGTLFGAVISYVVKKALDGLPGLIDTYRRARHWEVANEIWQRYNHLVPTLQVVQEPWVGSAFREEDIAIVLERDYSPPDWVRANRATSEAIWRDKNLKDNPQIGVWEVDVHRVHDELRPRDHLMLLRAHQFRYFDFLASNRCLSYPNSSEQRAALEYAGALDCTTPPLGFANPLSVGLSLFCEGGDCLAMFQRTTTPSSGGMWAGGLIFNAVGETMNARDEFERHAGKPLLSPWNTAERALVEEVGFSGSDTKATDIHLHSFVYDKDIRDHKFFGVAVCQLARAEVERRWSRAPDKSENKALVWFDTRGTEERSLLLGQLCRQKELWSSEARFCTLRSLLFQWKEEDEVEAVLRANLRG